MSTKPGQLHFGELDHNVPQPNREILEKVLTETGHKSHMIRILPKANHLFLQAETGVQTEYPRLRAFVPGYFDQIGSWLRDNLAPPPSGARETFVPSAS